MVTMNKIKKLIDNLGWTNLHNEVKAIFKLMTDYFIGDAPKDGEPYLRKDAQWEKLEQVSSVKSVTGDYVDNTDPENPVILPNVEVKPYKSYVALLAHSGVALAPPSVTVLENNLGFVLEWFSSSVGSYFTQNTEFNSSLANKVIIIVTAINKFGKNINLEAYSDIATNGVWLFSKNGTTLEDGLLSNGSNIKTTIEVRIYD